MAAESILGSIVSQGFGGLLTNLATAYISREKKSIKQDLETVKRDLSDHLEQTFNKCNEVKTILNSEKSVQTLSIYVDQRFSVGSKHIDQYAMVDRIRHGESVVILGEGGGGKSMFMRYLWLSYFEKSDGKIPFFIELRTLNALTHKRFLDFVFYSVIKSGSTIRQGEFDLAVRNGEFVFFLDGFDEINFDKRDLIQDLILELKEHNPALTIVVTSRHDERFMGWRGFSTARVQALDEKNAKLLIERADYNPDLKKKFLQKFSRLFKEHQDFLSNPLLAYMMLVTFSYNPDIPNKMFLFYEQAFEALYHRHDLTKGYKRQFHCTLDKMDFIRLASYFCLKTYFDYQLEFSRLEALEIIEQAKKIERIKVDADKFLDDLIQSVCVLKAEGLTLLFTHRSFQEYFAAYCISRVAIRNVDKLFSRFATRYSDKVLSMVSDINPDLFREKFIAPNAEKFKSQLDKMSKAERYEDYAEGIGAVFRVSASEGPSPNLKEKRPSFRNGYSISLEYEGPLSDFFRSLMAVATSRELVEAIDSRKSDEAFVAAARRILGSEECRLRIHVDEGILCFDLLEGKKDLRLSGERATKLRSAFDNSMMSQFIQQRGKVFFDFVQAEKDAYNRVSEAFGDFF